jgi:hypothetical protein
MIRRIVILGFLISVIAPFGSSSALAAAPTLTCNASRLNMVRNTGGEAWRCNSYRKSNGSLGYRWARVSAPGQTPADTGSAESRCLALSDGVAHNWINDDNEYWQKVLNQKTGSNTSAVVKFTQGVKVVSFSAGTLRLMGSFGGVGVRAADDTATPTITVSLTKSFIAKVHIETGFIVIDEVDRNETRTVLSVNGEPGAPSNSRQRLEVGDRLPFKCQDKVLAIGEPGLNGLVTTTYQLRNVVSA